jgi:hypothetical protein
VDLGYREKKKITSLPVLLPENIIVINNNNNNTGNDGLRDERTD